MSGASVDPTSKVCSSAMLVLPTVGTFGSSAQHTNHYTTKAMRICFQDIKKERSYETDIVDVIQVLLLFVCTG